MKQDCDAIVVGDDIMRQALDYLDQNRPKESLVLMFGKKSNIGGKTKLLVTDIRIPNDSSHYAERTEVSCAASSEFMIESTMQMAKQAKHLVAILHFHPMHGLSHTDKQGHLMLINAGFQDCLTGYHYQSRTAFYRYDGEFQEVRLCVVNMSRYDRQIRAYGYESQLKLASITVAIVGCGGGGFVLSHLLAVKGIGRLILVDGDSFSEDSLNRMWVPVDCIGKNKAEVLSEMLSPFAIVQAYPVMIEAVDQAELEQADIFIAFTDSVTSRLRVNRIATALKKPAIFLGTEIRASNAGNKIELMVGECMVYEHGHPCYMCNLNVPDEELVRESLDLESWKIFAKKYGLLEQVEHVPSIIELNCIIASLGADELTKLVTSCQEIKHRQYWDHLNRRLVLLNDAINSECWHCSGCLALKPQLDTTDIQKIKERVRFGQ